MIGFPSSPRRPRSVSSFVNCPLSDIYYSRFTIYDSRVLTKSRSPYHNLDAFNSDTNQLNVIVDTPKGNRNKFEYDEKSELFKLSGLLPVEASFPYDFGFVPSTRAEDGDPLDVLLLMDDPAFVGCLVPARLLGVIEAEQTELSGDTMQRSSHRRRGEVHHASQVEVIGNAGWELG